MLGIIMVPKEQKRSHSVAAESRWREELGNGMTVLGIVQRDTSRIARESPMPEKKLAHLTISTPSAKVEVEEDLLDIIARRRR